MVNVFEHNLIVQEALLAQPSIKSFKTPRKINQLTLAKHCTEENLPWAKGTLLIGSLSKYRTAEDHAIRDEHEGKFTYDVSFDFSQKVTAQDLGAISMGVLKPSWFSVPRRHNGNLHDGTFVGGETAGKLLCMDFLNGEVVHGRLLFEGRLKLSFDGLDAFVFCLTERFESEVVVAESDYDARWILPKVHLPDLVKLIKQKVEIAINRNNVPNMSDVGIRSIENRPIKLLAYARRVKYSDRHLIVSQGINASVKRVREALDSSAYIKPHRFGAEHEVRIILRPVVKWGLKYFFFPLRCDPEIIDVSDSLDLFSSP